MNHFKWIVAALLVTGLTGCIDNSSPQKVIESLAYTVVKDDLKGARKLMEEEALEKYGSEEGFAILKKIIGTGKELTVGSQSVLNRTETGSGHSKETDTLYQVDIEKNGTVYAKLEVRCKTYMHEQTHEHMDRLDRFPRDPHPRITDLLSNPPTVLAIWYEVSNCAVTRIP